MKVEIKVTDNKERPIDMYIGKDGYRMGIDSALTLQSLLTQAIEDALKIYN